MDGTSFWRKRSQYPSSSARTLSSALLLLLFTLTASPLVGSFRRIRLVEAFFSPSLAGLAASAEVMATVATQSAVAATMNFMLRICVLCWFCL